MSDDTKKLETYFWNLLLQKLGTNIEEVPLPKTENNNGLGRDYFDVTNYALYLDHDEEFLFVQGLLHEGTHAIHHVLSGREYCSELIAGEVDKFLLRLVTDESFTLDYFKRNSWQEGIAYTVAERLFAEYCKMRNYKFEMKMSSSFYVRKNSQEHFPKHSTELILKLGKDTGYMNSSTFFHEYTTLDSLASIVGYCCVSKLDEESLKRLVRQKDAHTSSIFEFNTSYSKPVRRRIRRLVNEYLSKRTYFDGIIVEKIKNIVPEIEAR